MGHWLNILGLPLFFLVKIAGNALLAKYINKKYNLVVNVWTFSFIRLVIGLALGLPVFIFTFEFIPITYFLILFPVRMLAWHVVFNRFYLEQYKTWNKFKVLALASLWSCFVDAASLLISLPALLHNMRLGPCL